MHNDLSVPQYYAIKREIFLYVTLNVAKITCT